MREAGHRRILLLVQRIELEHRVIRLLLRAQRQELRADRIAERLAPIDERSR